MVRKKKYAVHPGFVTSRTDGDRHFISGFQLANLYLLHENEYVVWDEDKPWLKHSDYIHLYPRYDGKYGRPQ